MEIQHKVELETMFATLYISMIMPIQVHPMTYSDWRQNPASMVQASIDTARIIGLPRLKTMDSTLYRTIYINEIQSGAMYRMPPRKAFIRDYVN